MHLGIAPSLRLEIASNLGLPIVHVISSQALSDEQRSHGAKAPGQIESVISLRTLRGRHNDFQLFSCLNNLFLFPELRH
jgi:hypothetical protein